MAPLSLLVALTGASCVFSNPLVTLSPPLNANSTSTRPENINSIWHRGPAPGWLTGAYPVGNSKLAAMVFGDPSNDTIQINIDSLWTGGPYHNNTYSGGNYAWAYRDTLADLRAQYVSFIFENGTGIDDGLEGDAGDPDYGSYSTAGQFNITSAFDKSTAVAYTRWLDLDEGVAYASWTGSDGFTTNPTYFCSYPALACVIQDATDNPAGLPSTSYSLSTINTLVPVATCSSSNDTIIQRGRIDSNNISGTIIEGMLYEVQATLRSSGGKVTCDDETGLLTVTGAKSATLVWTGETEYDIDKGTNATGYTFRGADPHTAVVNRVTAATAQDYETLLHGHLDDYTPLTSAFRMDIGQANDRDALAQPIDELLSAFEYTTGSPLVEYLVWAFGRHLLISSSRPGTLPFNLQGKWANYTSNAWGADVHLDVNLQMMLWPLERIGLSELGDNVWEFMAQTYVGRGSDTAEILYQAGGWVAHGASNIFGYTGMMGYVCDDGQPWCDGLAVEYNPEWADFPTTIGWVLLSAWDKYDFSQNETFWIDVAWPLFEGHTTFYLDILQEDKHFNDSSLIINPCNSPEQNPVTFGCSYEQQIVWERFQDLRKAHAATGVPDSSFLSKIEEKLEKVYDGVRIGSWGQLQEWKIDMDVEGNQHRHLSHLQGLYPGYIVSGYYGTSLGNESVLEASEVALISRGNGSYDSNAGWEKVWRSLCYSQLRNASAAAFENRFMIYGNLEGGLFNTYSGVGIAGSPFQMDANAGTVAAVVNMLFQTLDTTLEFKSIPTIWLLPALPTEWPTGSFTGGRLRGGYGLDLFWEGGAVKNFTIYGDKTKVQRGALSVLSETFVGKHLKVVGGDGDVKLSGVNATVGVEKGGETIVVVS